MMTWKHALVVPIVGVAFACTQSAVAPSPAAGGSTDSASIAPQGLQLTATVDFGIPSTGSPFPPGQHDQSFHAPDTLVPQTVVIDVGGTVTFSNNAGVHQVAVYEPGVGPRDIDTTLLGPGCAPVPVPLINDPNGRIAVLDAQPCAGGQTQLQHTFTEPGRYLVICTFLPHFTEAQMYGWVIVRNRS